jgi:hypothetical protein
MPANPHRMNDPDSAAQVASQKAASQRKKQIIVVLLLVGLLIAIVMQPAEPDAESGQVVGTSAAANPVSFRSMPMQVQVLESPGKVAASLLKTRELSRIELPEVTDLELLAPEPTYMRLENQLSNVPPVQAIYGTSTNRAALVGETIIRSGQPLPSGQKVLDITTDGVRLAH